MCKHHTRYDWSEGDLVEALTGICLRLKCCYAELKKFQWLVFTVLMKYGYGGSKNNGNCSDDGESVRVQLLVIGVMQRKKSGSITVLLVFCERRSMERD